MSLLEITRRHPKALSPSGARPAAAPAWIDEIDNPYLHGHFAPVAGVAEQEELPLLAGELPADLRGAYFRNGPNPRFSPRNRYHWFDGDGMVHGVWFDGGRARYASRWVQTPGLRQEDEAGHAIWPGVLGPFDFSLPGGPLKDTANTDLVAVGGTLLALWYESGRPLALDADTLATLGPVDFDGALLRRVSAHSKVDPQTGDFVFFGYGDEPPWLWHGVVSPGGDVHLAEIALPGPRRPHDIGVTPRYTVLHDFPMFYDPELFQRTGKRVPLFHPEVPTRFGVVPRRGVDADVRWFEFEPCYMLHVVNAWEEGDWVVMVGCRNPDPSLQPDPRDGRIAAMLSGLRVRAGLHEWRMNLATGEAAERALDDYNAEFPAIAPAWVGRRNRFAYLQDLPCETPATFDALLRYDLQTGERVRHPYGEHVFGSEAVFAARPDPAAEDDGYVITFVTDATDWHSEVQIFDAHDIAQGPVARLGLPQRVPAGFHATWMPAGDRTGPTP